MDLQSLAVVASALFAVSAGIVGGAMYAVRKTSYGDVSVRLAQIETDIAWIKETLKTGGAK
jgi:hypothetical protein